MISPEEVASRYLELLRAGSGLQVGDGEAPANRTRPYLIFDVVPGQTTDGSSGDPHEQLELVVQVRAVAAARDQAQWALHKARAVTIGRTNGAYATQIAGAGWVVFRRDEAGASGVDHEPGSDLWNDTERWRLYVTPA